MAIHKEIASEIYLELTLEREERLRWHNQPCHLNTKIDSITCNLFDPRRRHVGSILV